MVKLPKAQGQFLFFVETDFGDRIGEAKDERTKGRFQRRALLAEAAAVVAGGAVFVSAYWGEIEVVNRFWTTPFSLATMVAASILVWPVSFSLKRGAIRWSRALSSAQVTLILLGWLNLQYPYFMMPSENGSEVDWTFAAAAAPEATLRLLSAALVLGGVLILPALIYLFHVFKGEPGRA